MRKNLVWTLIAMFILSVTTGIAFAADPFVDVPANHWAYKAVSDLAKAGLIDGYGDGTFRGDRQLSRYEMAALVAKLSARYDKADTVQKAVIERLQAEFSGELQNMGVRISNLEAKTDNVKLSGEFRFKAAGTRETADGQTEKSSTAWVRTRLWATAQIDEHWTGKIRFQNIQDFKKTSGTAVPGYPKENGDPSTVYVNDETSVSINRAYVEGNLNWGKLTLGRYGLFSAYGYQYDGPIDGIKVEFGNKLKTTAFFGRAFYSTKMGKPTDTKPAPTYDSNMTGLTLNYGITKDTNIKGTYFMVNNVAASNAPAPENRKYWELGMDSQLSPDWNLRAVYGKSDAAADNSGYAVIASYKDVDRNKPGTYNVWLEYGNIKKNSLPNDLVTTFDINQNQKGYYVDFSYMLAKNFMVNPYYQDLKRADGSDWKSREYGINLFYYF